MTLRLCALRGLNPVEQVWQFLRQHQLAHRCFENEKAVIDACCDAWNWFEAQPQRISKLTQRYWVSFIRFDNRN